MTLRSSQSATRVIAAIASLGAVTPAGGCAHASHIEDTRERIRTFSATAVVHHVPLEIHLAAPVSARRPPVLVLYASGDGGWFGAAVDMFHRIGALGYAAAGFSSKAFLKIDRPEKFIVDTRELAGEYDALIVQSRTFLGLKPDTPVILTGWSRGAAFAVLAASDLRSVDHIAGVVAIGLAEGEDLRIDGPEDETDDDQITMTARRWPFEPYRQIALLGDLPCAVIQATGDNYFPAARARALFGSDTTVRRFYTVNARNHRFSGGKEQFDRSLSDALTWIAPLGAE
jgi:dienelactone hydrolase